MEEEESDAKATSEKNLANDGNIPEWAQMLELVTKLPTNVGIQIRKCVYEALEKGPPEWARKILEHSISKEVYKGNASGPMKELPATSCADAMVSQNYHPLRYARLQPNSNKGRKKKIVISISKVFCNLMGRKLTNSSDNDDEGLLRSPAMVSRPLDFLTIDLRLAAGAYGGSHEAFLEDVHEVHLWNNVRVAFGDQPDLVELAENLSQNFKSLHNEEVGIVSYVEKFTECAKLECLSTEMRKEINDFLESTNEIPKVPWDEGVCKVCGIDRDDESVLLYDTCDAEYHTYCLNPPLARIPEGNWYCPSCVDSKHATHDLNSDHEEVDSKLKSLEKHVQENVPPILLVQFLREHWSEWADYGVDAYFAACLKASPYVVPCARPGGFPSSQVILPLTHTIKHEEVFIFLIMMTLILFSEVNENSIRACAQLVFAPIDESFTYDALLLPFGFYVIPLDPKTFVTNVNSKMFASRTLDLASTLEVGSGNARPAGEADLNGYKVAMVIAPSRLGTQLGPKSLPGLPKALALARWICRNYRIHTGIELFRVECITGDAILKQLWHHFDAIMCCSVKTNLVTALNFFG
ncbi:hypothetical protein RJT34_12953 [Clitoria ternatea]|uniref:PHD-type domain-containing protein n=1 Tax=Clitoria ternatea TaxID=43366 RepID=A0AAN9PLE1_CLITE